MKIKVEVFCFTLYKNNVFIFKYIIRRNKHSNVNNQIIEDGKQIFNQKLKEIYKNFKILRLMQKKNMKIMLFVMKSELFNNVMTIDKFKDDRELLNHDFIKNKLHIFGEFNDDNNGSSQNSTKHKQ